jgi:hypothetical protein
MPKTTQNNIVRKVGKHAIALVVVFAVVVGVFIAALSINAYTKRQAVQQVATNRILNDGTTHDMTIVWPDGKTETVVYSEMITPKHTTYTGPDNLHQTVTDMVSFNPLDSANKAVERMTPSTFAEGDRPAIRIDENGGMSASKVEGANAVGQGGSNPVMGEYIGWVAILVIGLAGLFILSGVFKWLWAEWQKLEPTVIGSVESVLHIPTTTTTTTTPTPMVTPTVTPPVQATPAKSDPLMQG